MERIFGNGQTEAPMRRKAAGLVRHRREPHAQFVAGLAAKDSMPAQHIDVSAELYRAGPSTRPPIHDVTPDGPPGGEPRKPLR